MNRVIAKPPEGPASLDVREGAASFGHLYSRLGWVGACAKLSKPARMMLGEIYIAIGNGYEVPSDVAAFAEAGWPGNAGVARYFAKGKASLLRDGLILDDGKTLSYQFDLARWPYSRLSRDSRRVVFAMADEWLSRFGGADDAGL